MESVDHPRCLDLPTPELLTLGGDSRSLLNGHGMTRYGTVPGVRDAVPFGSCSASSLTPRIQKAARDLHGLLRKAAADNRIEPTVRATYRDIRFSLLEQLNIDGRPKARAILSPCGTSSEFLASLIALGDRSKTLCNIVVGPQETGSGSETAAAGLYYDSVVPFGTARKIGTAVSGPVADLIKIKTVALRDEDGIGRSLEDIDAETEALVSRSLSRRQRVLLHLVCQSKTGLSAPSLPLVNKLLNRFPEDLTVVVDAAQGRLSRQSLWVLLGWGFLVLITGSKFFGGPPFCGALLVPDRHDSAIKRLPPIPVEFGSIFSREEFPPEYTGFASQLPHASNLGLLLRWGAALEGIRGYYSMPERIRSRILDFFERRFMQACSRFPRLEIEDFPKAHLSTGGGVLPEEKRTVFSFRVKCEEGGVGTSYLRNDRLKQVAQMLNQDLSTRVPGNSADVEKLLARKFHIGQPVFEGDERHPAVLRVAVGAALVNEVGLNGALGSSVEERCLWLDEQIRGVLEKLDWVAGSGFDPSLIPRCR